MTPKRISKNELISVLREITERIANDDSFEGSINYTCMDESCARNEFMVQASWREGNSMGQGGMNIIGTIL